MYDSTHRMSLTTVKFREKGDRMVLPGAWGGGVGMNRSYCSLGKGLQFCKMTRVLE